MNANVGAPNSSLNLRYSGLAPMNVRGAATGKLYQFSPVRPVQVIDLRDAQVLLSSPNFRLSR